MGIKKEEEKLITKFNKIDKDALTSKILIKYNSNKMIRVFFYVGLILGLILSVLFMIWVKKTLS